ncbi:MAG: hypothetical protein M1818_005512 [Claussenomyces sp. TS43310]|nr:MAG: hypothetical protein M1818_005512 [Claussenomyces sp. TS43310]
MSAPIVSITSLKDIKKIGFIVPSSNAALEIVTMAILAQLPLVSMHCSRVSVTTTDLSAGAARQFSAETLLQCAELLSHSPVETILWNGTSESWTGEGYAAGRHIRGLIETATGLPASTSSLAQVEVLQLWGIQKIALATPYGAEPTRRLGAYYRSVGFEVVGEARLDLTVNTIIAETSVDRMRRLIRDADHPDAQCIVLPCTNLPAALLVEEMERELGKPVFDSVIVTLWKALRLIGVETPIHGWGQLLRSRSRRGTS